LTRASILFKNFSKMMDCRVKPGNDGLVFITAPALQRTASQELRAALRPGNEKNFARLSDRRHAVRP
jgi:hypothetical protein